MNANEPHKHQLLLNLENDKVIKTNEFAITLAPNPSTTSVLDKTT
jgi:hypothetical protein